MTFVRDRAILGSSDLEPDESPNTTWQCPLCGKFTSDRTADDHTECFQAMHDEEMTDLRAHVEGW